MKTLKYTPFILSLLFSIPSFAALAPIAEQDAIRSMAGCYKVTFHFTETFVADANYPVRSKEYKEYGTEWVELDQNTGDQIALQHILLVGGGEVQKHWRQEWVYQPTEVLNFTGNNTWELKKLTAGSTQGMWSQRVGQVDDSPRYDCVAPWVQWTTADGVKKQYWECEANAPLPRREFTQRSDYQILKRRNRHEIIANGWLHEQDNGKMSLATATDNSSAQTEVAREKGLDSYIRINDSECADAKLWWALNKGSWHAIQEMWNHVLHGHIPLKLKAKVDGKTLWMRLFALSDQAVQSAMSAEEVKSQTHEIIHEFMIH